MAKLIMNAERCNLCGECARVCPFGAVEISDGHVEFNAACKMCKICIKTCPQKAIILEEVRRESVDKSQWAGVLVYVEHNGGEIHPVTFELLGKARELAAKIQHPVYCLYIGSGITKRAEELLHYGADKVLVYDHQALEHFRSDLYADIFEDCICREKPSIVLVGGTCVGRSLAPRLSTRFQTGLTADCTFLDVKDNTDLIQVRPAFGGNVMARIITPTTRPQFATVRYKVMDKAERVPEPRGVIKSCTMPEGAVSGITVLEVFKKQVQPSISEADIIVAGGRGFKSRNDLWMVEELARQLGGQTAFTRPIIEAGWANYTRQIGLSGRTVRPQLIITCGISGAIQFASCMNSAACIIAINKDRHAPIFKIAHYVIVGDLYEVVPDMIEKIKRGEAAV